MDKQNIGMRDALHQALGETSCGFVTHWLVETGSTNEDVKSLLKNSQNGKSFVVVADYQTAGRGTHGRRWVTPKESLLLTLGCPIHYLPSEARGLTLCIGACVVEALRKFNSNVVLKWPNDIWIDGKKVCGISCEIVSCETIRSVVVGIGVNIALNRQDRNGIDSIEYMPGALFETVPESKDQIRVTLASDLIRRCMDVIEKFPQNKLTEVKANWSHLNAFSDMLVSFETPKGEVFQGYIAGLGDCGELKLQCGEQLMSFVDGTLRPVVQGKENKK